MSNDLATGFDVESHLIKRGMPSPQLVCGTFARPGEAPTIHLREETLDKIETMLGYERIVAHNATFDIGVLAAERPRTMVPKIFDAIDRKKIECTMLRHQMIDNATGELKYVWDEEKEQFKKQYYALDKLAWRALKIYIPKGNDTWRLRYNELDGKPLSEWPAEAIEYACKDAVLARDLREHQEKLAHPTGIPGENSQVEAAWALQLMHMWGVRTDPRMVETLKSELTVEYAAQQKICVDEGFVRATGANAGSKDLKKIRNAIYQWHKDTGLPLTLTPKGAVATTSKQLRATGHPGLKAVAEANRVGKLLTTYVPVLERGTEVPINARYNTILETFRTSCSDPNLQNPPRAGGVRECFMARPGYVFVFCDYDTLEMRTLGQVCIDLFGYSDIIDAIKSGKDLHVDLAADLLGIPYADALARYENGDPLLDKTRQGCKIGNYGLSGGMGPDAFMSYAEGYGTKMTRDEAVEVRDAFRRKWSEMSKYFDYCGFLTREGNATIEFVRSGMYRGDVGYTQACNGFFQHLAAMGAKTALYQTAKECYNDAGSPLYGSRPWLFAHDEIGMEVPIAAIGPKRTHEAAMRLQQVMIESMSKWCPDVPIGATPAMTRNWWKGAKAVYQNGIMVPCKPHYTPLPNGKKKTTWVHDA